MSEQQIMAEEMQSPKKVAFANRKYTNEERVKKEEEELEQLLAEQKGEEVEAKESKESEPKNAEERSFKKRYGDLRRHQGLRPFSHYRALLREQSHQPPLMPVFQPGPTLLKSAGTPPAQTSSRCSLLGCDLQSPRCRRQS